MGFERIDGMQRPPGKIWFESGMNEVVIARSTTVLAVLGVIATMYFAKAVFLPLALANPPANCRRNADRRTLGPRGR
jgi:hypothetical protein